MRIIKNLETMAACCVLCLTACQQDEFRSATSGHVPVRFAPERATVELTRVTDDSKWEDDDEIGIYMVPDNSTNGDEGDNGDGQEENNVFEKYANEASNRPYVIAVNGDNTTLTAANNAKPICYPVSGDKVGFVAYYPYSAEVSDEGVYQVNVQNQSKPEAIDLLYAKTETDYNRENTEPVALNFTHQLSKLILNVTHADNITMNLTKVTLQGFHTTADFDLTTGKLSPHNDNAEIVLFYQTDGGVANANFTAILIPDTDTESDTRKVAFTIDEKVYFYEFDEDFALTAGSSHMFTLTFNGTKLSLTENEIIELEYTTKPVIIEFSSSAATELRYSLSSYPDKIEDAPLWLECKLTNKNTPDNETNWDTYELTVNSESAHMTGNTELPARTAYIHLVGADKTTVITVTQAAELLTLLPSTTNVEVSANGSTGNTFSIKTNSPDTPTVSALDELGITANSVKINQEESADTDGYTTWDVSFDVSANDYYILTRTAEIYVEIGDIKKTITIKQPAPECRTNVPDGLSNCYVLESEGSVTFSVKRAYADVATKLLRVDGDRYEGTFTVELLWYNDDVVRSCEVEGTGPDAMITINAGKGTGNAVVALRRDNGDIVWSYHIWRSNVKILNGWLDRSLGSEHAEDGTPTRAGNVYQWGRKDPFPGSFTTIEPTDVNGWYLETNTNISLEYSILNPRTFIRTTSWTGCDADLSWDNGGRKTVYDPCPAGYRVMRVEDMRLPNWQIYLDAGNGQYNTLTREILALGRGRDGSIGILTDCYEWWGRDATLGPSRVMQLYMNLDFNGNGGYTPYAETPSRGCCVRCIAETPPL